MIGHTLTKKTGLLAGAFVGSKDQDMFVISSSGIVIRVAAADIRRVGRASQGVRTMRVEEGATVVALAQSSPPPSSSSYPARRLGRLPASGSVRPPRCSWGRGTPEPREHQDVVDTLQDPRHHERRTGRDRLHQQAGARRAERTHRRNARCW